MIEFLENLDIALFLLVNVGLANPVTDFIMPIMTSDRLLRGLYGVAMILLLWKGNARLRWMVLLSAIALAFSDQLSSHWLKPMIGRIRPCHLLDNINLLVHCGGGLSMPSSHAANAFGQAALFGFFFRRVRNYLYLLAALIAVSRVFVGVHYPGDVIAGGTLGVLIAVILASLFNRLPFPWSSDKPKEIVEAETAADATDD